MKPMPRFTVAIAEGLLRLLVLAVIFGTCVHVLMNHLGGSAMFCMGPPAADPGWGWKVPLAWFLIYGASGFVASWLANVRPRSPAFSLALAAIAAGVILFGRLLRFQGGLSQFLGQPEFPLGPLGLVCGMIGGAALHGSRARAPDVPSEGSPSNAR